MAPRATPPRVRPAIRCRRGLASPASSPVLGLRALSACPCCRSSSRAGNLRNGDERVADRLPLGIAAERSLQRKRHVRRPALAQVGRGSSEEQILKILVGEEAHRSIPVWSKYSGAPNRLYRAYRRTSRYLSPSKTHPVRRPCTSTATRMDDRHACLPLNVGLLSRLSPAHWPRRRQRMETMEVLALVGGHVEQEILLRNEYLAAENDILKSKLEGRLRFTDSERIRLAKIAKEIGRKGLQDVPCVVKPETLLRWYRDLVAKKFDGSKHRAYPGHPKVDPEVEALVVRFAKENPSWGYDRIQGALANLGHHISDQTVGNILERHGIPPAPKRQNGLRWHDFIEQHKDSMAAADFFTTEVLTAQGLLTLYVLFVIHVGSRRVHIAGITPCPHEKWTMQAARNLTMAGIGFLAGMRYLIHDRDGKFCPAFDNILRSAGVEIVKLPPRSPNLNPVRGALGQISQR